mgnify:CR=1 FL=1
MRLRLEHLLVLPVVLTLLTFTLYPFLYQIYLSFTNASIYNYLNPPFAGVDNYVSNLFSERLFWDSMRVTATFVIIVVSSEFLLGLGVALLVFQMQRTQKILMTLFILPMSMAPVYLGIIGRISLHNLVGIIPYLERVLGLPILSYTNPTQALFIVSMFDIWQWTPFMFLIIFSGLVALPHEALDAAQVDGASGLATFRHVILPLLRPVLLVGLVIRAMDAIRTFDIPYIINQGGPGAPVGETTTISVLIYKLSFAYNRIGTGAAAAVLLSIVLGIVFSRATKYLMK